MQCSNALSQMSNLPIWAVIPHYFRHCPPANSLVQQITYAATTGPYSKCIMISQAWRKQHWNIRVKYARECQYAVKGRAYSFASALFYHHMYMYVCVCHPWKWTQKNCSKVNLCVCSALYVVKRLHLYIAFLQHHVSHNIMMKTFLKTLDNLYWVWWKPLLN